MGATQITGKHASPAVPQTPIRVDRATVPRAYPREVRGVHVTMGLAGLEGKID